MNHQHLRTAALAAAVLVFDLASPASAAIRCDGSFQINSQGEFNSLYCQEDNLAKVARRRGMGVTVGQIRASLSTLHETCLAIGPDISVSDICGQFNQRRNRRCIIEPC